MTDITTNALRGIVKTLGDVVMPAIPADDPLAQQELKMVIRYLNFARERIDHLYARARYELGFHTRLAADLAKPLHAAGLARGSALRDLAARADALLDERGAAIETLRDLNLEIAGAISAVLNEVTDTKVLDELERKVVDASAEITAFHRSWYAPLKLERFPSELRPLASFIPIPAESK
jgi:hypothetical protein